MTEGVVDAVKANQQLKLVNTSARGDANAQASQAQDLVNRKVDALIVVVSGIDGTEQALAAIRQGTLAATLSQNPLTMAAQSVKYVTQFLDGKTGIPAHVYRPHLLLTEANVDSDAAEKYGLCGDDVSRAK